MVLNEPKIKHLALSLAAETLSAVADAEAKSSQLDLAAAERVRQGTADTPAKDGLMGKGAGDTPPFAQFPPSAMFSPHSTPQEAMDAAFAEEDPLDCLSSGQATLPDIMAFF